MIKKKLYLILSCARSIFWHLFGPVIRLFLIRSYLHNAKVHCLQIGCGFNMLPGWLNTDLLPRKLNVAYLNAEKPLPFPDSSFDNVFCEHIIEHIPYESGVKLINECGRILRIGGKIRLSTPKMQFLLDLYNTKELSALQSRYLEYSFNKFMPKIASRQRGIFLNHFMHAWGHKFIYDEKILHELLSNAGFINIHSCIPKQSNDPLLCNLEQHGQQIPEEFNLLETMVLEASRIK